MKLSIVLIDRNDSPMLKQALESLSVACKAIDHEIILVSTSSSSYSGSFETDYPQLHVINITVGTSISKAKNLAINQCFGEYVLMVNADTICSKDGLEKVCAFMDEHRDAGGVSVRMLSPEGRFLPESIHGLTAQWAVFLKLIGFAKYLSKTRLYDRNRKDWVEEFQITEIDILSSDFMMLRRSALNEVGSFDERFAMYGHNIDLSYRIRLAGFKNYYFPKTYIINFETGQLPKFSWDYIRYFYGAMIIFAMKYLIRVPQIKVHDVPQFVPAAYDVK